MKQNKEKTRPNTSRPGVCDRCGCAVVRFHEEMHITAIRIKSNLNIDGHVYKHGELKQVRCALHSNAFPYGDDIPPAEDARGGSGAHKNGPFFRYMVEGATMAHCCEVENAVHRALNGEHNDNGRCDWIDYNDRTHKD